MLLQDLPDPVLITHPGPLGELARALLRQPAVAVDTESNSLYAYREQVCLVQFSTPEDDYLVDPLALGDLSPLAPVFASSEIEKVFHAAEYDLICMSRDYGFRFANLFDTMLAARILGKDGIGLGSILEKEFGVRLDKRYQRANWGQRPLPEHLLAYARLDTHYLIPLRDRLCAELEASGLWALALEDFNRLARPNQKSHENGASCWRINGVHELDPRRAAVLQELCVYRERVARAQNRPLFKVISDRALLAVADACPQNLAELKGVAGMSPRQVQRHGKALLLSVQKGMGAQPLTPPRAPRPAMQLLTRLEALREWRKKTGRALGMESDVVLPRDLLQAIAERDPRCPEDLAEVMAEVPWRLGRFGEQILEVLFCNHA